MLLPGLQRQFNSSLLFVFALGVLVAAGDVITSNLLREEAQIMT